jgi:hypothetical protein
VSLSAAHLGRQGQAARCDESSPRLLKTRRDETIDNHLLLPLAWTARATHALTSTVVPSPGQAGRNPTQPDQTGPRRGGGRTHRIGEQQPAGPCSLLPAACLFSSATLIVTAAATTAAGYAASTKRQRRRQRLALVRALAWASVLAWSLAIAACRELKDGGNSVLGFEGLGLGPELA